MSASVAEGERKVASGLRVCCLAGPLILLLAGCSPAVQAHAGSSAVSGRSPCTAPSPYSLSPKGAPQVQSTASGGQLWALPLPPPQTEQTLLKIVLRMTGTGALHLSAAGPGGQIVPPAGGPFPYMGSDWDHPGDEWGTLWNFPAAGCWDIRARRTDISGDIWLDVAATSVRITSFSVRRQGHHQSTTQVGMREVFIIWAEIHNAYALPRATVTIRHHGMLYRRLALPITGGTDDYTATEFRRSVRFHALAPTRFSATARVRVDTATASKALAFQVRR